jgi:hypothetical protein
VTMVEKLTGAIADDAQGSEGPHLVRNFSLFVPLQPRSMPSWQRPSSTATGPVSGKAQKLAARRTSDPGPSTLTREIQ